MTTPEFYTKEEMATMLDLFIKKPKNWMKLRVDIMEIALKRLHGQPMDATSDDILKAMRPDKIKWRHELPDEKELAD